MFIGLREILEIHGEKIFINTGAQTVFRQFLELPPRQRVYDSTGLLNLKELPWAFRYFGGGYIGVEFASCSLILAAR